MVLRDSGTATGDFQPTGPGFQLEGPRTWYHFDTKIQGILSQHSGAQRTPDPEMIKGPYILKIKPRVTCT